MHIRSRIYGRDRAGSKLDRGGLQRSIGRTLWLFCLLGILLASAPKPAAGQASWSGNMRGTVLEAGSGTPISGAVIEIEGMGLVTNADALGRFAINDISLSENPLPVTIAVTASDYGEWRIEDVLLLDLDTLILNVELETDPVLITMPPPRTEVPGAYRNQDLETLLAADVIGPPFPPLPETITVRVYGPPYSNNFGGCDYYRSDPYETQVIDFKYYVKHVLPREWVYSWPGESLRAGAMVTKTYGWYWVLYSGTWDVRDDVCDQVYDPTIEYESTNNAVDFTWNWRMTRGGQILQTFYRALGSSCPSEDCIGQWDTYWHSLGNNGYDKLTWDEMLELYYAPIEITAVETPPLAGYMLRFYGNGWADIDRVKILLDPPVPADVGGAFTLEWWMRADTAENGASVCSTGSHEAWTNGNIIFDRDVFGDGDYGVSLAGGRIAFGVNNGSSSTTVCGSAPVADNHWHHVAVVRGATGDLSIFVDGHLDESTPGPTGDISYRDGRSTNYPNSDPFLVIGAEKHDAGLTYPSYNGFLDDIHLSDIARYTRSFSPPNGPFTTDGDTVALFHFDEGRGDSINDNSGASGGPSDGQRRYGGDPNNGPEWFTSDLIFLSPRLYLPLIVR